MKHGHTAGSFGETNRTTPTYNSWVAMRQRCLNPNADKYPLYGGRGVTIDPRWDSFEVFLEDMGERPAGLTLDRKDSDGSYCKDNCRWSTAEEQAANRRPFLNNNAKKTHCKRGHQDWAYRNYGARYCRTCRNQRRNHSR